MPVYNGAKWLAAAIESVLAQTLYSLELLVVDDASSDGSVRIAELFRRRDPRVRVLCQPRNRGQSAARNLAVGQARGEWIAPVDADDEIRPDRLRRLLEAGQQSEADLIADGILFEGTRPAGIPAELRTWGGRVDEMESLSAETLIKSGTEGGRCSLGYLKPLMRRRFLDQFGLHYLEDLRFAEDFNLYVRALFCGARFLLYPESHYVYWQTPSSASRTELTRIARQALSSSERLRAAIPQADSVRLTAALDEYEQRWLILSWIEHLKIGVANRHLRHVVGTALRLPASPLRVLQFARERARVRRQLPSPSGT